MWLYSFRVHVALAWTLNFITLCASMYGSAYGWYLLDSWGARPDSLFDMKVFKHISWFELLPPFVFIYFYPTLSVFIAYKYPILRISFILIALFPLWLSFDAIGQGGDRKGCESCDLPFWFNLVAFPALYVAAGLLALAYTLIGKIRGTAK